MHSSLAGVTSVALEIILSYHYMDVGRRCVVSDNECKGDFASADLGRKAEEQIFKLFP